MSSILSGITLPEQLTLGYAVGRAAGGALEPFLIDLVNSANEGAVDLGESRPLNMLEAAAVAAMNPDDYARMEAEAKRTGHDATRFADTYGVTLTAPGTGELLALLRRGAISGGNFTHGLRKHRLEPMWDDAMQSLRDARLEPVQIANAIHRGLLTDPGLLAVAPPSGTGNVPSYPTFDLDPLAEAESWGIARDRLGVLVGLTGLPMGPHEAAQAVFRNILTQTDFQRAVAESNTRNEWGQAILEQSRQIPTARDFIENALRGYRTLAEAQAGAALHGMSPEHARLIFQNSGRPLNLHQITQALAWGAKYNPLPGDDPDPYMNSVLIGAVTPAYYEMQDTLKYTLPSAFFLRVLQQQGVLTEAEAVTWYKRMGWHPDLAAKVAHAFAASTTTATADPHVSKAQTQLWNKAHTAYVNGRIDATAATAALGKAGVDQAAIADVLSVWDAEAALVRSGPSKSDIRKQYREGTLTVDAAVAELTDLGWNPTQAQAYLVE